jgi:hypothetical protein
MGALPACMGNPCVLCRCNAHVFTQRNQLRASAKAPFDPCEDVRERAVINHDALLHLPAYCRTHLREPAQIRPERYYNSDDESQDPVQILFRTNTLTALGASGAPTGNRRGLPCLVQPDQL